MGYEKAITALQDEKNEPVNWLLGNVLRKQANASTRHFLLELLEKPFGPTLASLNWRIAEFRAALLRPEMAPRKAALDLKAGVSDAEEKMRSFLAEVFSIPYLRTLGYTKFDVLLPGSIPTPDFDAVLEDRKAKVEVKNLREPEDLIRTVASKRWRERQAIEPERYNFRALLTHSYGGPLSSSAMARLRSIIDQLPETKKSPLVEELDGGVRVRVEKLVGNNVERSAVENHVLAEIGRKSEKQGQLIIGRTIRDADLKFDLPGFQSLFLKALRRIVESIPKFFGENFREDNLNVIVLRWEPPDPLVDSNAVTFTQEKIKSFFSDFGLNLQPLIFFQDPEVPTAVLRGSTTHPTE